MDAEGVGVLILDGQCLRVKDSFPREHWPTTIWPAGFTPHVNEGVVEIRNGAGRVVAQVGDQIAGGGGFFDRSGGDCSGPVWWANTMKTLPDVEVYFPKQDGTLAPEDGTVLFSGKLILFEKCLQVADDVIRVRDRVYAGISPLIIWPTDFALSTEDGVVKIVDGTGNVVARVGDEVEFDAFNLTYEEAREHGGLAEITPACSGPYWAVGRHSPLFLPRRLRPDLTAPDVVGATPGIMPLSLPSRVFGETFSNTLGGDSTRKTDAVAVNNPRRMTRTAGMAYWGGTDPAMSARAISKVTSGSDPGSGP